MYTPEQQADILDKVRTLLQHETCEVHMSKGFKRVTKPEDKAESWVPNNTMTVTIHIMGGSHDTDANDQRIPESKHPLPATNLPKDECTCETVRGVGVRRDPQCPVHGNPMAGYVRQEGDRAN